METLSLWTPERIVEDRKLIDVIGAGWTTCSREGLVRWAIKAAKRLDESLAHIESLQTALEKERTYYAEMKQALLQDLEASQTALTLAQSRDKTMMKVLELAKIALAHTVPEDCYSTGPKDGTLADYLLCPACHTLARIAELASPVSATNEGE